MPGNSTSFGARLRMIPTSEGDWDVDPATDRLGGINDDRDLYAGYSTYNMGEDHRISGLYMFDRIRNVKTGTLLEALVRDAKTQVSKLDDLGYERDESVLAPLLSLAPEAQAPETDSHYLGLVYEGKAGIMDYFLEGIYQFGQADNTGLDETYDYGRDDYDINAFAVAGDLEGYTGVVSFQRFTAFGGENTIIGDGNTMLGTVVPGRHPKTGPVQPDSAFGQGFILLPRFCLPQSLPAGQPWR